MRYHFVGLSMIVAAVGTAWGQPAGEHPHALHTQPAASQPGKLRPFVSMAAISQKQKLLGDARMRYLLRQLDLDIKQRRYARELLDSIYNSGDPGISLAEVHAIVAEIEKARAAGDKKREQELAQELRDLARRADRDREFLMNMETVLTEKQKELLKRAQERLKANPSGAIRPIDIFRAARELDLDQQQRAKLDDLARKMRAELRKRRQITDGVRYQMINSLIYSVRELLTPEQLDQFDLQILRLRSDLIGDLRARLPKERRHGHGGKHKPAAAESDGHQKPAAEADNDRDNHK